MKKIIFILAAVAAISASCSSIEDNGKPDSTPDEGIFTISAVIPQEDLSGVPGKTTVDAENGYKVSWDDEDALSVIAEYSDGTYKAYRFVRQEGDTFVCDNGNIDTQGITAVNVVYPYDSKNQTMGAPVNAQEDYNGVLYCNAGLPVNTGDLSKQAATDDISHIDGLLCGYSAVSGNAAAVTMKHATTLFDVAVENAGATDVTITEVRMVLNTGFNLVGWFQIAPETASLWGTSGYKEPSITVTDGTLAAGETGHFYMSSIPFKMSANLPLSIKVTTSDGQAYTVDKTQAADKDFLAGKVNHITGIVINNE